MRKIPYQKEELELWCKESDSYNEVLVKSGRTKATSNRETLKKYIKLYNIDVSHFTSSTSPVKRDNRKILPNNRKICSQCHLEKDAIEDYYWSNGHTRNICKDCVKENERRKYNERVKWLSDYKRTLKCKKCGESRYYLLDFHHRNPNDKKYCISDSSRSSKETLMNEIKKCDVLCANCHREWHYLNLHENLNYNDWLKGEFESIDC